MRINQVANPRPIARFSRSLVVLLVGVVPSGPAAAAALSPPYSGTDTNRVCAPGPSGSTARCEVDADRSTGGVTVFFEIVSPDEGTDFGSGAGFGHAEIVATYEVTAPVERINVSIDFRVESAEAIHTGLLTNTIGLVSGGWRGWADAHLIASAAGDCGIRRNYCRGGAGKNIVSTRGTPSRTDELFTLRYSVVAEEGSVQPGTIELTAGAYAFARLSSANYHDTGTVRASVDAVVERIEIEEIV